MPRKRSYQQERTVEVMRAGEIEGQPWDGPADATMLALERRGDVTKVKLALVTGSYRWTLTEQGRGGPAPEASQRAQMIAGHLTSTQRDCLLFWPRGHWQEGTVRALRERNLIEGRDVTEFGREVRAEVNRRANAL